MSGTDYQGHPDFLRSLLGLKRKIVVLTDEFIADIAELHSKKSRDYGAPGDPFANFHVAEEIGLEAWLLASARMMDKVSRVKTFIRERELANEGFEDALDDLASYALIVKALWEEAKRVRREITTANRQLAWAEYFGLSALWLERGVEIEGISPELRQAAVEAYRSIATDLLREVAANRGDISVQPRTDDALVGDGSEAATSEASPRY